MQKSLEQMLGLPEEDYVQMSRNSVEFVKKNFTWAHSAKILLDGYSEVLEKKND